MSKKKYSINYDHYNEDDVEQEILSSKPTSFLILGKPCTRKKLLAKKLAEVWKCVLITAGSLAKEAYTQKLKLPGVHAKNLLLEGESLSEEMMYNFLKLKLMTNEISHRGYVLVDFPSFVSPSFVQQNFFNFMTPSPDFVFILYLDSEDMNKRMKNMKVDGDTGNVYFSEQYLAKESMLPLSQSNIVFTPKDEDDEGQDDEDDENEIKNSNLNNKLTDNNIRSQNTNKNADDETDEEIEDAEAIGDEMIKEKNEEEDEDNDEKNEKDMRKIFQMNEEGEEEEEEDEISFSTKQLKIREDPKRKEIWDFEYGELQKNYLLPLEEVHKLVTPISAKSTSLKELNEKLADFDTKMKEMLLRYDPMRIFRFNALKNVDVLLEEILEILKCFHARPAFMVNALNFSLENIFKKEDEKLMKLPNRKERKKKWLNRMNESKVEEHIAQEEQSEDVVNAGSKSKSKSMKEKFDDSPMFDRWSTELLKRAEVVENEEDEDYKDQFYETLRNFNCLSPSWFWRKSIFSHYCPVSLYKGLKISGDIQYAASFLNKVYVFASLNSLKTFYENPRPFLKAPPLKIPGNVVVLGLPFSGRTTLSHLIAKKFNAEVIDVKSIYEPMQKNKIDAFTKKVTKEIKDTIKMKMANNILNKRNEMQEELKKIRDIQEEEEENEETEEREEKDMAENPFETNSLNSSKKTLAKQSTVSKHSVASKKGSKEDEDGDENENSPSGQSIKVQEDEIGSELKAILDNITISDNNQKVLEYVKDRLATFDSRIPVLSFIQELEKTVYATHKELSCRLERPIISGGCVFDNFPNDLEYWKAFVQNRYLKPSHIFHLNDSSKRKELVLSQWYKSEKRQINDEILGKLTKHLNDRLISERIEEFNSLIRELREFESPYDTEEDDLKINYDRELNETIENKKISETNEELEKIENEEDEKTKEIENLTSLQKAHGEVEKQDQEKPEKENTSLAYTEYTVGLKGQLSDLVNDLANEKIPLNPNENKSNNSNNNNTDTKNNFISMDENQMLRWTDKAEEKMMNYKNLIKLMNEQFNSAKINQSRSGEFEKLENEKIYQEDFVTNIFHTNKINKNFNPYENILPLNLYFHSCKKAKKNLKYKDFKDTYEKINEAENIKFKAMENNENFNNNSKIKLKNFDQSFNRSNNNDIDVQENKVANSFINYKSKDFFSIEKKEKLEKFVSKMSSKNHKSGINQDLLTTLGLPYDHLLNAALKEIGFVAESTYQDTVNVEQSLNRQDNIKSKTEEEPSILIKEERKKVEPLDYGMIHITCLVQQLLNILSYLPLEGPSKIRMDEKIYQAIDAWQAVSEFLKESSVQFFNIEIGRELMKENGSDKEFEYSLVEENQKTKDDEAKNLLKPKKSSLKSDTLENASRNEIEKTQFNEEYEKLKKEIPELTFEVFKYFRDLEIDFIELTQKRWKFKTPYEILNEALIAINDAFEFKAQEGIKYQENPHPTLQEVQF